MKTTWCQVCGEEGVGPDAIVGRFDSPDFFRARVVIECPWCRQQFSIKEESAIAIFGREAVTGEPETT